MSLRLCPSCALPLNAGHNFCPACGARVTHSEDRGQDEEALRARLQRAVGPDFEVGRLLGRGGFAEVFAAEDVRLGRPVAIKTLRSDLPITGGIAERFQREARAMAALRHPHVLEVYTVGSRDGVAYMVMPLVEGETLEAYLEREGPLAFAEARRILREVAAALDAAHETGVVHRDVKPENILLEGPNRRVLMADFGIVKAFEQSEDSLTRSGVFVGTPQYASPEQLSGDVVDHRSDIYSLGVVAYRMIAGRLPFEAESVQALVAKHLTEEPQPLWTVRGDCPETLAAAVDRCLAKDPGERWESLGDLVAVVEGRRDLPEGWVASGVPGLDGGRAPQVAGGARTVAEAVDALNRPLRAFRRFLAASVGVWLVLLLADGVLGLGGVSVWAFVVLVAAVAAHGGRLWSAGYEWGDLFHPPGAGDSGRITTAESRLLASPAENFGRFSTLVRGCVGDRAAIVRVFAGLAHQERERVPDLVAAVDDLVVRVKHLAIKIVGLESRLADAARRRDETLRRGASGDAEVATAELARRSSHLQELNAARDEAAVQLRRCAGTLAELRDILTEGVRLHPARALDELARRLPGLKRP